MNSIREARKKMLDWAKQNIPENGGIKYDMNIDEFKELTVRRGDIKNITKHVHENAAEAYCLDNQRKEYRVYCIRDSSFNTKIIQFLGQRKQ